MADLVPLVPKYFVVLYDGTNKEQIFSYLSPDPGRTYLISESDGVLNFRSDNLYNIHISTGTYVLFTGCAPYAVVGSGEGLTAEDLAASFYGLTPGTLPS